MTLDRANDATLAGRIEAPSADYPSGTFRTKTAPTANDGTPAVRASDLKDMDGFRQAVIALGKLVASGVADTALVSQILEGIQNQYGGQLALYDSGSIDADKTDRQFTLLNSERVLSYGAPGTNYFLAIDIQDGAVVSFGTQPGSGYVKSRKEVFDASTLGWAALGSGVGYTVSGGALLLPGIPFDVSKRIISTFFVGVSGTGSQVVMPAMCTFSDNGSGVTQVVGSVFSSSGTSPAAYASLEFLLDYDPTNVD